MADIRKGKKIDDDKAKTLDRNKMGVSTVRPPQAAGDVQGQARYGAWVMCPCNGDVTWATLDTDVYLWFTCGVCGCTFEA